MHEENTKSISLADPSVVIYQHSNYNSLIHVGNAKACVKIFITEHFANSKFSPQNKPLALPYAEAIYAMVPSTPLTKPPQPHESINDLPVHTMTLPQIFYPASESRQFNRTDAGRVFSAAPRLLGNADSNQNTSIAEPWEDTSNEIIGRPGHERPVLKPADARIPHPHMIAHEKDKMNHDLDSAEVSSRYQARLDAETSRRVEARQKYRANEDRRTTRVQTARTDYLFSDCQTTQGGTGPDGRGIGSPGARYGVPTQDRKRGRYKLPKQVEV